MFGLHPRCAHTPRRLRGRSRWTAAEETPGFGPAGSRPGRLAQLPGADPRGERHMAPDTWGSEPALVLSDVVAGREPWTGMLLDPARPRPAPTRHWLV